MSIKILLVEDHAIIRQGLYSLIEKQADMEIIAEASFGQEALEMSLQYQPDIILMDVSLPDISGMEATRQIKAQMKDVKVLALSAYDDEDFVMGMIDAGTSGYLLKECCFDDLLKAINVVMGGESFLSPKITSVVLDATANNAREKNSEPEKISSLREQDIEVLKLLAEGKSAKNISNLLGISIKTIEGNRRQIMQKIGVDNFADLVKYAIKEGITSLDK